jgi:hypothetical protein
LHPLHLLSLSGFGAVFAMAGLDRLFAGRKGIVAKLCRFARYFLSMNLAIGSGFVDFLRGPRTSVWEPTRRETAPLAAAPARSDSRPEPMLRR